MIKLGFEAEFICPSYDYLDFSEIVSDRLGVITDVTTMFDYPTYEDQTWYTSADHSINEDQGNGVEIISPPGRVSETMQMLPKILLMISAYGFTDISCGLHFTISATNANDIRDIIQRANDKMWLRAFDRSDCITLQPSSDYLTDNDETFSGKIFSINQHNPGRIEFKHIGGQYYENRLPLIKMAVENFISATLI